MVKKGNRPLIFMGIMLIVYAGILIASQYAERIIRFETIKPPTFLVSQPEVIDGDIITTILGQKMTLVDRLRLSESAAPVVSLSVSPDKTKLCFQTQVGTVNTIYRSNWDGTEAIEIAPGENCSWSPQSDKICYLSPISNTKANHLGCHYLESGLSLLITSRLNLTPRIHKNLIWSQDNRDLFVQYQEIRTVEPKGGILIVDTQMRTVTEK